jgi:hypothetical protein
MNQSTYERYQVQWMAPGHAYGALHPLADITGCVGGCIVKLDPGDERHDLGPSIRQAWYSQDLGAFVCSATAAQLHHVIGWALA